MSGAPPLVLREDRPLLESAAGASRALRAGVRVVPVALRLDPPEAAWIGGTPFLPHYWRMTSRPSLHATVRFGEPVDARAFVSAQACTDEVRARVERLLQGAR